MANKPKFLKNLLTTASAFAMVTGIANVQAADVISTGAGVFSTGANFRTGGAGIPPGGRVVVGSNVFFGSNNDMTLDIAGDYGQLNPYGFSKTVNVVGVAASFTAIKNDVTADAQLRAKNANDPAAVGFPPTGGLASPKINFAIQDALLVGGTMEFHDITDLGNITLDALSTARFKDNGVVTGTISGTAAGKGIIEVNADVEFTGEIGVGVNAINQFKVTAGNTATLSHNLTANGAVTLTGDAALHIAAGKTIGAADIQGNANNNGTLVFEGDATVNSLIGNGNSLSAVNIQNGGTVDLTTDTLKATTVDISGSSTLKLSNAGNTIITGNITSANDSGKIQVSNLAATVTFVGNVGTNVNLLDNIELAATNAGGASAVFQNNGALEVNVNTITTKAKNQGSAVFKGDTITINADIGTDLLPLNEVTILSKFAGAATTAHLAAGATINAKNLLLANVAAVDNILILDEGSAVKGAVTTLSNGKGILQVEANASVGSIIANTAGGELINYINFTTADKTLTVEGGDEIATTAATKFSADATLAFTGAKSLTINKDIVVTTPNAAGVGTIRANNIVATNTLTLQAIGDTAVVDHSNSLKLLEVTGGGKINLAKNASIREINMGANAASELTLNNGNDYFIGNLQTAGKVNVTGNVRLLKDSSFVGAVGGAGVGSIHFNGNHTLTIQDNVNFFVNDNSGFIASGKGEGIFAFQGNSTVNAAIGTTAKTFNNITVNNVGGNANGSIVTFEKDVFLANSVTIGNLATARFNGNLTAVGVDGAGLNEGTLSFRNVNALETNLKIGNVNSLANVEIGGSNITFKNADFKSAALSFVNTNGTTVTFANTVADPLLNLAISTQSTTRQDNIILMKQADYTLTKAVGTADKSFGNITLGAANGGKIIINTDNFYAGVLTETDQKGQVEFTRGGSIALNIGKSGKELESVAFNASATIKGNGNGIWARNINIAGAGIVATFEGTVSSSLGVALNGGSVELADGATLNSIINGVGGVTILGGIDINQPIGSTTAVTNITMNGKNKIANIYKNLSAANISLENGVKAKITNSNVILSGATDLSASTLDLGMNKPTFQGAGSKFSGATTIRVATDGNTMGGVVVDGAGSTLNVNNATSVIIEIEDNSQIPSKPRTYTIFSTTNGGALTVPVAASDKVRVKPSGAQKFTGWSYDYTNKQVVQVNNAKAEMLRMTGSANDAVLNADGAKLANPDNIGDALATLTDIGKMTDADTIDALKRVSNPVTTTSIAIADLVAHTNPGAVLNRVTAVAAPTMHSDLGTSGIAAGEMGTNHGAWINPFFNQAVQKERKGTSGYRANTYGGIIGVDTMVNPDMTVGIAGTFARTEIKHKDIKSGDKTKSNTYMFSIYGMQQLTDSWFAQGVASYSSSAVKNSETRRTSTGNQTAKGSFDVTTYGADVLFGFNSQFGDMNIIPLAGISFTRINDGSYKETGTTSQNLSVSKKAYNKIEGVAGLRSQMHSMVINGIELTPEAHAFVRYDFKGTNPSVKIKLDGMQEQFAPKTVKTTKDSYNLGLSVNGKSGIYEYGVGYDLNLANKYVSNQGTLKVRINF